MIKNISKVIIVLIILAFVIYFVGLFDHQEKKKNISEKRKSIYKSHSSNNKIDTVIKKDLTKKGKKQL